jgi:ABC-2 type transport system permease protein
MIKFWRVAKHEYLRHVLRKRFLFALLSLPLFIVLIFAISIGAAVLQIDTTPIGLVDQSGLLDGVEMPEAEGGIFPDVPFIQYESPAEADEALADDTIQGYYVIAPDYRQSGAIQVVANEPLQDEARGELADLLRAGLLQEQTPQVTQRLIRGPQLDVRSIDGERELQEGQWLQLVIPIVAGVLFVIVINTSGGYLLQAVVEEKENRTMEIVITSVSPTQLMAGKIVGNLSVGLTQLLIWLAFPLAAFFMARAFIPMVENIRIEAQFIWLMILTLVPAFVLVAALMATVGATATESREAQQIAGLFTLPVVAPLWFTSALMTNPNGPLAVGLSLFPLTAPISLPLRAAFTVVPLWQIAISISLLFIAALLAIWLAGRAFRLGMLQYGKRLTLKELFSRAS